jgi:hypothetical protein
MLIVFSELLVEFVCLFDLQSLFDPYSAEDVKEGKQDATHEQLRNQGERGYFIMELHEV